MSLVGNSTNQRSIKIFQAITLQKLLNFTFNKNSLFVKSSMNVYWLFCLVKIPFSFLSLQQVSKKGKFGH